MLWTPEEKVELDNGRLKRWSWTKEGSKGGADNGRLTSNLLIFTIPLQQSYFIFTLFLSPAMIISHSTSTIAHVTVSNEQIQMVEQRTVGKLSKSKVANIPDMLKYESVAAFKLAKDHD